ncbi:uncharacterized protein B0I36DRAFT_46767 [Microdochium trichocladiopsis]|uniref:Uncharacterized protein n=1 Tax=Microdochium trichocladiopsis TaxID=1682393 RepID=A0A9P8XTJ2_9PEZI|nr:uncharacterized protein B0I36DRAFT_46767 [Microdochium trichocladiopsis]KAH7016486.1 hypothetical protein B0I36DRAFT_46767 [Microdochium trichocladiopsis]
MGNSTSQPIACAAVLDPGGFQACLERDEMQDAMAAALREMPLASLQRLQHALDQARATQGDEHVLRSWEQAPDKFFDCIGITPRPRDYALALVKIIEHLDSRGKLLKPERVQRRVALYLVRLLRRLYPEVKTEKLDRIHSKAKRYELLVDTFGMRCLLDLDDEIEQVM